MGIWQIVYVGILMLSLGMHLAKNGEQKEGTYSFWVALFSCVIQFTILYLGGFFS